MLNSFLNFFKNPFREEPKNSENETVIQLAWMLDKKNYSDKDIKPISQQGDEIKSMYGEVLCTSMNDEAKIELIYKHAVFKWLC